MATITVAEHAGFCFGVTRAVETAYKELEQAKAEGYTLYCLGSLIHNKTVTEELSNNGLVTINNIMEAPENSKVLIRAHGEPDRTYELAKEKGIELIDATCPFVEKIHKIAREADEILVIGDAEHPEVKGILGCAKKALGATTNPEEVLKIISPNSTIVAQTTISKESFESCIKSASCSSIDTICKATKERQDSAYLLAKKSDLMVVIGDFSSSNSKKLYELCKKACKNVVFVENSSDLPLSQIKKYNRIGVAASASAPASKIKEVVASMSDAFKNLNPNSEMAAFMEEIEKSLKLPGRNEIVDGTVVQVAKDHVVVNMGCKKDGILPVEEVALEEGQTLADAFAVGDAVQAKVIKTDDGDGNILLSKKKLQSGENWDEINAAMESKELIDVVIVKEVKGGVVANYKEVSGFIPMSQLADHYVETAEEFIGKTLPVRVTRVDQKRGKVVFSHKAFLSEERSKKIAEIWDTLNVGDVVEGKVMRFTDYGAFVDIGGIDGLLHISEISWGKLKHPQEVLEIGQVLNVKILSMNAEKGKISLGLKQNAPEPWSVIDDEYQVGQVIKGKVVQLKEYGAFIELAPGLDGLVHISEIAYKRVNKVADELTLGQEVEAKILEIDKERKRISLSIKATLPEPEKPVEEAQTEALQEAPVAEEQAE
ncbi:MAG: bifunctional 4-hydroxy-3-methylbut-2-enyl diphosphate reductase/30S ribosomal protein S1 [Clostridia bacterium]|nr:bifunctional 4-hydroxy-3-methylbut-2-enyl diphosphate reductase/30S ribosomal protein S1 [Clostridia bacterium]